MPTDFRSLFEKDDILNLEKMSKEDIRLYCPDDNEGYNSFMDNFEEYFQKRKRQDHSNYTPLDETTLRTIARQESITNMRVTKGKYSGKSGRMIRATDKKTEIKFQDGTSALINRSSLDIIKTPMPVCIDISELSRKLLNIIQSTKKISMFNHDDSHTFTPIGNWMEHLNMMIFPHEVDLVNHYEYQLYGIQNTYPQMWEYFKSLACIIHNMWSYENENDFIEEEFNESGVKSITYEDIPYIVDDGWHVMTPDDYSPVGTWDKDMRKLIFTKNEK